MSHAQAASLPLAALTAWQALTDHAGLQPGERVLVQGGAGGVGVYVVQLAVILGADVTATGRAGQGEILWTPTAPPAPYAGPLTFSICTTAASPRRLEQVGKTLGIELTEPTGLLRASLALTAWRLLNH